LRTTYRKFYKVLDGQPDPDVWVVTKKWIDVKMGV
jgi:hypothetical protein